MSLRGLTFATSDAVKINSMKSIKKQESGATLIAVLSTILIVSLIAANVLINCATRYNATSRQVKAWKESLYAAEAGADIGYEECRKAITPGTEFTTAAGWTSAAANTWTKVPAAFGVNNTLSTTVTVDKFWTDPVIPAIASGRSARHR
jgi:Tfp pilus assembly protein PilX